MQAPCQQQGSPHSYQRSQVHKGPPRPLQLLQRRRSRCWQEYSRVHQMCWCQSWFKEMGAASLGCLEAQGATPTLFSGEAAASAG